MLARKSHDKEGIPFSEEWKKTIQELLNNVYQDQCQKHGKQFEVFGISFDTEVLVAVSFLESENQGTIPLTCYLSADKRPEEDPLLFPSRMLDAHGVFFDHVFTLEEWEDLYSAEWEEYPFQKETYFIQVTRENVRLTLEADRLLREFGE